MGVWLGSPMQHVTIPPMPASSYGHFHRIDLQGIDALTLFVEAQPAPKGFVLYELSRQRCDLFAWHRTDVRFRFARSG